MLGRLILPDTYEAWNAEWNAPSGRPLPTAAVRLIERRGWHWNPVVLRRRGPFGFQPNNLTRRWEYPWAFHAVPAGPGVTAVDLGGALSGFQFALASAGVRVINVDPFLDFGSEHSYRSLEPVERIARLNAAFGTSVELRRAILGEAGLGDASVDTVYCISTIEHLDDAMIAATLDEARRVLRPGGHLVLTVDLFLDLAPFTSRERNRFGTNVDVKAMVAGSGLELTGGRPEELYGYDDFDADRIQSDLSDYLVGNYPGLAQCLVLEKP